MQSGPPACLTVRWSVAWRGLLLLAALLAALVATAGPALAHRHGEPPPPLPVPDPLTPQERAWLQGHPVLRLAPDPDFAPIEFFDEQGEYAGLAADYAHLLEQKLGLMFTVVRCADWSEVLRRAEAREVDVLNAAVPTPEREPYLRFAPAYLHMPMVIITRQHADVLRTPDDLAGRRVALVRNYGHAELIVRLQPRLIPVPVESAAEGLRRTAFGQVDAFYHDLATASYAIDREDIANLQVSGRGPADNNSGFAVRSDWAPLAAIIDKGMRLVTPAERAALDGRWINLTLPPPPSWRDYLPQIAGGVAVAMAILLLVLGGNILLRREVANRTAALRASEQRLQQAQRVAHIGSWELDLVDNRLLWSDEIYRIFELEPRQFGAAYEDFLAAVHPDDRAAVDKAYRDSLQTRQPYEIVHRLQLPDGRIKFVEERCETYYDPAGRPLRSLGTVQDITRQKMAEEEADRHHRLLDTLLATLPIGVFMVEAPSGKPLVANAAARELLGRGILPAVSRENLHEVYQAFRAGTGKPYPVEEMPVTCGMAGRHSHCDDMLVIRPDGTRVLLEVFGCPVLDRGGKVVASLVSFFDITERKRAEQELRDKNEELEKFTYTVSHDLKSPLTTIKGFAGAIGQDLAQGRTDRLVQDLKRIENAADKMAALVYDLLELSRLGKIMRPPLAVGMEEMVQEALTLLTGKITEKGVSVRVQPGLPAVRVDRSRFVFVLQNLIENAVKYMGEQPRPRIEIGMLGAGEERVFFVTDNGMGIEERCQDKVFGLFNKLDPQTEGTGIGLTVVRRIIEAHGGRVWLESAGAGAGCTFFFTVPEPAAG